MHAPADLLPEGVYLEAVDLHQAIAVRALRLYPFEGDLLDVGLLEVNLEGYVGGGLQMQVDLAIDPAGNIWVGNNWQNLQSVLDRNVEPLSTLGAGQGVVVFYGLAKPVKTPLIGPVQKP